MIGAFRCIFFQRTSEFAEGHHQYSIVEVFARFQFIKEKLQSPRKITQQRLVRSLTEAACGVIARLNYIVDSGTKIAF